MEEVCERENLKEALQRVKANQGSAGVDRMTIGAITDYSKQHWPAIREQLLRDLRTEAGQTGGNPQAGWRGAETWHPNGAESIYSSKR
jgi:hypothetical protein